MQKYIRDIRVVPVGGDLASGLSLPECWLNRNYVSTVTFAIGLLPGYAGSDIPRYSTLPNSITRLRSIW
ncbi:hypothetical protein AGR6A_pTi0073 [Agrobacterium sp. NCPPB 925]|nr:hypothetical protein AGR6A_pTi0073 [Agrobacterium sp. NCPPB 925]